MYLSDDLHRQLKDTGNLTSTRVRNLIFIGLAASRVEIRHVAPTLPLALADLQGALDRVLAVAEGLSEAAAPEIAVQPAAPRPPAGVIDVAQCDLQRKSL